MQGLVVLPWWGYVVVALIVTHITIVSVTLYLHRHQAHRAMDLHPAVAHFMRFWLWLTTGMITREWVAVHRKHHAFVETEKDPHSPQIHGINKVLLEGAELYRVGARDEDTVRQYSHGTPDDWIERNLYSRFATIGISTLLIFQLVMFGALGLTIWAVQMLWIPVLAAGVINGVGHWRGYRNFETEDTSTNILPIGILIGGEELHNNHHAFGSSARFSARPWEFDIGWFYIRVLQALGLAKVKKLAPRPRLDSSKTVVDLDTVSAVASNRLHVMAAYARDVIRQVHKDEVRSASGSARTALQRARKLLSRSELRLDPKARAQLSQAFAHSHALEQVYEFKQRLQDIWNERTATPERLLAQLDAWCHEAHASGIRALQQFAEQLRGYTLQGAPA
ncbi:MAG: transposase [Gammaproteobacteria bacterium]|nr:transposase [Gammaproteobacteria bacterium]